MTTHDILVQVYHLLTGSVFVLGAYVVGRNLKRYKANREKLLPLHVWLISASYLIMVATFLHPDTNYAPSVFIARFVALAMGIYALWVLVKHQNKRRD